MNRQGKKVLTFLTLKMLELGSIFGLTFGIYFLGKWVSKFNMFDNTAPYWINGLFVILLLVTILLLLALSMFSIYFLFSGFIRLNWKWACILNETPQERIKREGIEERRKQKEEERNAKEQREIHGYYIGDKVKIIKAEIKSEEKYVGKVRKIENISPFGGIGLEGTDTGYRWGRYQVEPIKKFAKGRKGDADE